MTDGDVKDSSYEYSITIPDDYGEEEEGTQVINTKH